ncbi:hypothetical protein [Duganella radicis]|uniref:DUF4760 domain-containing protein n=1 Tax=Duganella radicis TaxID=551988 RepID=A0A6L6PTD3_9BURK|nr:hypothetical protein [Duganella radicis]MTV41485.1 hypothetical protein [Duganella radicis]
MLETGWQAFQDFTSTYANGLHSFAELIKIIGAFASFYALLKLRKIEHRYLFKATIPGLIENIGKSLSLINEGLLEPENNHTQTQQALNHLLADVKTVQRRVKGDSAIAAKRLVTLMRRIGFEPYFWQRQIVRELTGAELLEIYVQASGLVRLLANDLDGSAWSSK